MATTWTNETKRQVGATFALMDDTEILMDSTTVLFGAVNPATVWTTEAKTS